MFDVKETMRVQHKKDFSVLPFEQRFLSGVKFSVYEVIGVAWQ